MNGYIGITTLTGGEESRFSSSARVERGAGGDYQVGYLFDGDECLLSVKEGAITQSRRGAVSTDITFKVGERTECRIDGGEGDVFLEVDCLSLVREMFKSGERISLEYIMADEVYRLKIVVSFGRAV